LHGTIGRNRYNMTVVLIKKGAKVNAIDCGGYSMLMLAAELKNPRLLKLILTLKPNLYLTSSDDGTTALQKAYRLGRLENVTILLKAMAKP